MIQKPSLESAIASGLGILGLIAYAEASTYQESAGLWPEMLGSFLAVGGFIFLFKDYLPGPVANYVKDSSYKSSIHDDLNAESHAGEVVDRGSVNSNRLGLNMLLSKKQLSIATICLYVIVGYLFGLLWATPVYVLFHGIGFDVDKKLIILLTVGSFILAFAFMEFLNLPLDTGVLYEGL